MEEPIWVPYVVVTEGTLTNGKFEINERHMINNPYFKSYATKFRLICETDSDGVQLEEENIIKPTKDS